MVTHIVEDTIFGNDMHSESYVHYYAIFTICFIILSLGFVLPVVGFNLPGWAFFSQPEPSLLPKGGGRQYSKKQKKKQRSRKKKLSQRKKNMKKNIKQNNSNQNESHQRTSEKKSSSVVKKQESQRWKRNGNDITDSSNSNKKVTLVNKEKMLKPRSCMPKQRSVYRPISTNSSRYRLTRQTVKDGTQAISKPNNLPSQPSFTKKSDRKLKKKLVYQMYLTKFKNARKHLKPQQRKSHIYHSHKDVCSTSSCHFAIVPGSVNTRSGMIVTISIIPCNHIPLLPFSSRLHRGNRKYQWNDSNSQSDRKCTCPCPSCSLNDLYISAHVSPSLPNNRINIRPNVANNSRPNSWPFVRPQHTSYPPWGVGTHGMQWHSQPQPQYWHQQMTSPQPCKYGQYCNRGDCRFVHPESNNSFQWCPNQRLNVVYFPNMCVVQPGAVRYN